MSSSVMVGGSRGRCVHNSSKPNMFPRLPGQNVARLSRGGWRPAISVAAKTQKFGSFDELIQGSEMPLLVDFYATWCGPCQMMVPELSMVSKQMEGSVKVVKIDTEKYPSIASKYEIQALPTLIVFKDGRPIDRIEGFYSGYQLMERLRYFLQASASS